MKIRPKDIKTWKPFAKAGWTDNLEKKVARNIVKMFIYEGSGWCKFDMDSYEEFCTHEINDKERAIFGIFVKTGHLEQIGVWYEVTEKFIRAILPYVIIDI